MDHETLYTASKWDILKRLERGPASPLALSKQCGTSIANVSQQLRLLEMAGLVSSERVPNRDKGKPRILYSLAGDLSYMIATADQFVEKRAVPLSAYNKIIMRIWFYDKRELHYALEKAFWKIEDQFGDIAFLAVDSRNAAPLTFYVKLRGKQAELKPFTVREGSTTHRIVFSTRIPKSGMYVLYDPQGEALESAESETRGMGDRQ